MVSIIYPSCYPGNTHRASAQEFIHRSHELDQSKFKIATATFGVILAAGGVAVGVAVFCVGTPVVAAAVATVTAAAVSLVPLLLPVRSPLTISFHSCTLLIRFMRLSLVLAG
jgi:hypothetical protein